MLDAGTGGPHRRGRGTRAGAPVPVLRADAALAGAAARGGGRVAALRAVETTLGPTRALSEEAARTTGAGVEVRLVPGAWAAFRRLGGVQSGRARPLPRRDRRAADEAARGGASRVALAQASMAGTAAPGTTTPPPLVVPADALPATVAASRRAGAGGR